MERFSSRPPRPQGRNPAPKQAAGSQEDFSQMVDATANKPGVFGRLLVISLIIVSIAVTAFVGYAIVNGVGSANQVDEDNYQAVFLSDGQIYFGKLTDVDKAWATLEDIYYLQVQNQDSVQEGASSAATITLVKLGNEIHGPQDKMVLNTDQVLFWENLEADGQVADAISRYQADGAADSSSADDTVDTTTDNGTGDTADTPAETPEN